MDYRSDMIYEPNDPIKASYPRPTRVLLQRRENRSLAEPKVSTMSPNVGNFVHDLVEMAKAMETLPQVQSQLQQASADNERLHDRIQNLEIALIERSREIDELNGKVRAAEEARDQAETMFLECDDKLSALRGIIEGFQSNFGVFLQSTAPAPTTPPPVAIPSTEQVQGVSAGQSDTTPMAPSSQTNGGVNIGDHIDNPSHNYDPGPSGVDLGQSEAGPTDTAPTVDTPTTAPTSVPTNASTDKPYHGKLYVNEPGYIPFHVWVDNGGTMETYEWREGKPLPTDFYPGPTGPVYAPF